MSHVYHVSPRRPSGEGSVSMCLRVPPKPRFARVVRTAVIEHCARHGVEDDDLQALLLALGEALANAIEHASEGTIEICCDVNDQATRVTVADRGSGFDYAAAAVATLPTALDEGGRGIPIMLRAADSVQMEPLAGGGTIVTLVRLRRRNQEVAAAT